MGVPFEALIPYGIIIGMYCVTGAGLAVTKYVANDGKKARWNRDVWDKVGLTYLLAETLSLMLTIQQQMMERDYRITGTLRGQSTNAEAPTGFEVSNPWKLEKRQY
ncbi:hypothetical protein UA08_04715 [Talaromyces atroroseus]|uniref:NADH dehydrogenase [ubiquinone] 1 alpha subcomplex subunit 1 n=1 Tax=Talaromyces atroroseus TaxID=1441469 RepID=A0A225AH70_TALAT|nr:hypothetical protein UA08_04715 [Talaromyces atroroseus]OKL60090.1 hypothetical protein UA08_04715 [Talaromyces atroroseus]